MRLNMTASTTYPIGQASPQSLSSTIIKRGSEAAMLELPIRRALSLRHGKRKRNPDGRHFNYCCSASGVLRVE